MPEPFGTDGVLKRTKFVGGATLTNVQVEDFPFAGKVYKVRPVMVVRSTGGSDRLP